MIKVKNITKKFGDFCVLDGLNLNVEKGSIYGLVGPNGAGKTTIINHITGVLSPDNGEITVNGQPVWENSDIKQKMLCINDEWFYFSTFTVNEMADFYKNIYKNFNEDRYKKLGAIMDIKGNRQIRRLSKGMKKQAAFRIVLSCMPDILILDEPLDGLDPVMRKQILNIIINDVAEREMTVLVSSHNLRELEDICDHIGIIHNGKMIIEKPLNDVKGNIQKVQTAFKNGFPDEIKNELDILHISKTGSVYSLIIRGSSENIRRCFDKYEPVILDTVNLTLEEVFIYELGGMGYDFKNIIL